MYQLFCSLAIKLVLSCFFFFGLGFGTNAKLGFGFPSNFTACYSKQLGHTFSSAVLPTFS